MSFFKWMLLTVVLCVVGAPSAGICAESSADVSASKQLKESALKEILAAQPKDGGQKDDYVIGEGDLLSISIYGEGDMAAAPITVGGSGGGSGSKKQAHVVKVRMDGQISLKHIGDVKAAGLTLTQLADYLKKLYKQIYDDPVVTTVLVKTNRKYSVMGKVTKPGVYPLDSQINLVQAIANSGGFTEWANHDVTVVRKHVGEKDKKMFKNNVLEFDYDDFLDGEDLQKNIDIQANDVIVAH